MQKHFMVALAAALPVAGLTAGSSVSFAAREVPMQPGESMHSVSRRFHGDQDHVWRMTKDNHLSGPNLKYAWLRPVQPEISVDGGKSEQRFIGQIDGALYEAPAAPFDVAISTVKDPPAMPWLPGGSYSAAPRNFTLPLLPGPGSPDAPPPADSATPRAPVDSAIPGLPIQSGLATWYGPGFVGDTTYCGDVYDQWAFTAASNSLPCGAIIIVTNENTGASVRVRVNDRGGFGGNVILDLSRAAFSAIASPSSGVVPVTVSQPAR